VTELPASTHEIPNRAISIRQPWAWAIVNAGKNIENRSWHTSFRGPVALHASKGMTKSEWNEFEGLFGFDWEFRLPEPSELLFGGIVGMARITDCVNQSRSKWFFGPWGFVLADVKPVEFIPCRGALGFFDWRSRVQTPAPAERQGRLL
jgi:hypothetical protein